MALTGLAPLLLIGGFVNGTHPSTQRSTSPYHLDRDREAFYRVLDETAAELLIEVELRFGALLDEHVAQRRAAGVESPRSRGEYAIELLTFGVLLNEYGTMVEATSEKVVAELERLWHLRSTEPIQKAKADERRGELFAELLWGASTSRTERVTRPAFSVFLRWLLATGEFVQEARRFATWEPVGSTDDEQSFAVAIEALAQWFQRSASTRLGHWTTGVAAYRARVLEARVPREDLLLLTRREVLYHLNLVGAQVMNRGFESGYATRPRKVVLLPGCMRAKESECRARRNGLDIQCTHCSADCQISTLTTLGITHGFDVYIVPHASSFTAWLEHWRGDGSTALVAAACPLHLVPGGYEMRALGIDAQCVLLDFSGCRRHWHPQGTPTRVDPRRLLRVVQGNLTDASPSLPYGFQACG